MLVIFASDRADQSTRHSGRASLYHMGAPTRAVGTVALNDRVKGDLTRNYIALDGVSGNVPFREDVVRSHTGETVFRQPGVKRV